MTDREVMQQALEALNLPSMKTQQMLLQRDEAIATLRAALAEEALQRLTDVQQEIEAVLANDALQRLTDVEMAESCGIPEFENYESQAENIMRFAALIRADEREACAKLVDFILKEGGGTWGDAIRSRSFT